jgi:Uncharacterised nucleotidyltransferase
MNRALAAAIVDAFLDRPADTIRGSFAPFRAQDWLRTSRWLHTSGLALYFLRRAREAGIVDVMPANVFRELEECHRENRARTEDLFGEFVTVNMEFQRTKLSYANVKGFTLTPRACPDPSYRYQHDLDFLVLPRDAERCRQAVERLGYRLKRVYDGSWEFVAGAAEVLSMRDLYRVRSQRNLEIHFASESEQAESEVCGDRLSRLQLQVWNGYEFPALSDCDKLLGQAQHLFRHLQSEWTRTAWMLEFAGAVDSHRKDAAFWDATVRLIDATPQKRLGTGVASLIASRAFGAALPSQFLSATVDQLPRQVRLWADCYQDDIVYAEHPGSKLYLLLQDVLLQDLSDLRVRRRKRLLPAHRPPTVAATKRGDGLGDRVSAARAQLRFAWERLRFHLSSGLRYKIEAARWKRLVAHIDRDPAQDRLNRDHDARLRFAPCQNSLQAGARPCKAREFEIKPIERLK